MKKVLIFKWSFFTLILSTVLTINYKIPETVPITISILILYVFYLREKILYLTKETQINVELIENNQSDIKILKDNYNLFVKNVKDLRLRVMDVLKIEKNRH